MSYFEYSPVQKAWHINTIAGVVLPLQYWHKKHINNIVFYFSFSMTERQVILSWIAFQPTGVACIMLNKASCPDCLVALRPHSMPCFSTNMLSWRKPICLCLKKTICLAFQTNKQWRSKLYCIGLLQTKTLSTYKHSLSIFSCMNI